jgi:hypothetical protein
MSTEERGTPNSTSLGAQSPQGSQEQLRKYNYEHFWPKHLFADLWRSVRGEGLQPGFEAPDFELESTEGDWLRLSALRGRPVVVHIGSFT